MRNKRVAVLLLLVLAAGTAFAADAVLTPAGDLVISTKGIGSQAVFFPFKVGGVAMEVFAVRAADGTVRTALNTCQVCDTSGRGYYTQKGDILVCNNCGNRFSVNQVELVKGGCNPVPITREWKKQGTDSLVIARAFLEKAKPLFAHWKKG